MQMYREFSPFIRNGPCSISHAAKHSTGDGSWFSRFSWVGGSAPCVAAERFPARGSSRRSERIPPENGATCENLETLGRIASCAATALHLQFADPGAVLLERPALRGLDPTRNRLFGRTPATCTGSKEDNVELPPLHMSKSVKL